MRHIDQAVRLVSFTVYYELVSKTFFKLVGHPFSFVSGWLFLFETKVNPYAVFAGNEKRT